MIELKNINLKDVTVLQQISKSLEEHNEFIIAVLERDPEHAIEELLDKLQADIGVIQVAFGINAEGIEKRYPQHLKKLETRPR